jgi:hypothetical protein
VLTSSDTMQKRRPRLPVRLTPWLTQLISQTSGVMNAHWSQSRARLLSSNERTSALRFRSSGSCHEQPFSRTGWNDRIGPESGRSALGRSPRGSGRSRACGEWQASTPKRKFDLPPLWVGCCQPARRSITRPEQHFPHAVERLLAVLKPNGGREKEPTGACGF